MQITFDFLFLLFSLYVTKNQWKLSTLSHETYSKENTRNYILNFQILVFSKFMQWTLILIYRGVGKVEIKKCWLTCNVSDS